MPPCLTWCTIKMQNFFRNIGLSSERLNFATSLRTNLGNQIVSCILITPWYSRTPWGKTVSEIISLVSMQVLWYSITLQNIYSWKGCPLRARINNSSQWTAARGQLALCLFVGYQENHTRFQHTILQAHLTQMAFSCSIGQHAIFSPWSGFLTPPLGASTCSSPLPRCTTVYKLCWCMIIFIVIVRMGDWMWYTAWSWGWSSWVESFSIDSITWFIT